MKRRGLSTIVGAVFFVIVMGSTITYVTYSIDLVDDLAYQIDAQQDKNLNRQAEELSITGIDVVNNEFNLTITNTGFIPINITKMWAKNMTDPLWNQTAYTLNQLVVPGQSISNIGQGTGLVAMDSSSYLLKFNTERGNSVATKLLSASSQAVDMFLYATPSSPNADVNATLVFGVRNNLTEGRILQSITPLIAAPVGTGAATYMTGPTPASASSLAPGEIAFFEWTYLIAGTQGNQIIFNTTIANAVPGNNVTDTVQIAIPPISQSSINEVLGGAVGVLQMDFETFESCEPVPDPDIIDCRSDSADWVRGWLVNKNTEYIWRVNMTNNGLTDIFLEENTAMLTLKGKSGGGGNINNAFFLKNPSTTVVEDGGAYSPNHSIMLLINVTTTVYFGSDGAADPDLEATNNEAGIFAANILVFGHEDDGDLIWQSTDTPYSQNLPFQAIRAT